MFIELPTRFHHARDFALTGQLAEANAANLETTDVRVPAATVLAAIILPRTELCGPTLLYFPG
jgi:hypothetical protein